jgi:hypothetical protein
MPPKKQKKRNRDTFEKDSSSVFFLKKNIRKLKRRQLAQAFVFLLAIFFIGASVASSKIKTLRAIKAGSITNPYIGNSAVNSAKIQDGTVSNSDLADNSVTTGKIADGQVTTNDIQDGTITAAKLASGVLNGSGSSAWGSITGTLSSQTDLQNALNDKADKYEITVGDDGYGSTFAEAITAIGSTQATLIIPSGTHEGGGITVPTNVTLKVLRGALLHEADGTTLTINGSLEAGLYQVFSWSGSGGVAFGAGTVKEVYPQWWGAKGDDSTDCTNSIQAAINAFQNIHITKGTFRITSTLNVLSWRSIYGDGPNSIIHQVSAGTVGLVTQNDTTVRNFNMNGPDSAYNQVSMGIQGYIEDQSANWTRPLSESGQHGLRATIENMVVQNWGGNGIALVGGSKAINNRIVDCLSEGFIAQGDNILIKSNFISGSYSWGIDVSGNGINVEGNILRDTGDRVALEAANPGYGDDGGGIIVNGSFFTDGTRNNKVVDNDIDGSTDAGVLVITGPSNGHPGYQTVGTIVSSNNIANTCSGGEDIGNFGAISITDNSDSQNLLQDTTVSGNTIRTSGRHGIVSWNAFALSINNNNISGVSGHSVLLGHIVSDTTKDVTIANNTIRDFNDTAIKAYKVDKLIVSSNIIDRERASSSSYMGILVDSCTKYNVNGNNVYLDRTNGYGIFITNTSRSGVVANNSLANCGWGIYYDASGDYVNIIGNDLTIGAGTPDNVAALHRGGTNAHVIQVSNFGVSVPDYANNAAAVAAGLPVGETYRITGADTLGVVH